MAPFNTLLGILILAIPLAAAIPRHTETISFQVTSLEESSDDAHCGTIAWPHSCWKYCGETGQWCWIQPSTYCQKDSDCDSTAPCSSTCSRAEKSPEFKALDAFHVPPQAKFEKPMTNAVKVVNPASDHISSVSHSCSGQRTSLEASSDDAHCGTIAWPHSCWKYCGETGQWCWIQPSTYCQKDSDCDSTAPCSSTCSRAEKSPEFKALDAPDAPPQAKFEKPVTNAVKVVNPASDRISSVSHSCSGQRTSLEASSDDAHCGTIAWPHSCWKYCGETGQWCWIQPSTYCQKDSDCDSTAPCSSTCSRAEKSPEYTLVKLLAA